MEEICIELKFPYTKPDKNGVLYSKKAIEKAFDKGVSNLSIVYIDNDWNIESVIGRIKDEQVTPEWDDSNGVCRVKVNETVFYAGISCVVKEMDNGVVKDFEITRVGISK